MGDEKKRRGENPCRFGGLAEVIYGWEYSGRGSDLCPIVGNNAGVQYPGKRGCTTGVLSTAEQKKFNVCMCSAALGVMATCTAFWKQSDEGNTEIAPLLSGRDRSSARSHWLR